MEKKTASDMRLLLSSFEPEYPVIKKGYIARLIVNEKLPIPEIFRKIKEIVQTAEPDTQIHEAALTGSLYAFKNITKKKLNYTAAWTEIFNLHNQTFNIPFQSQTVASTPMPMQQNTPEIPAAIDLTPDSTHEILSVSVLSGPPSPKRLRRDCDNCVAKQRTSMNMLKENKRLRQKLRRERKMFSLKTLNEKIRRKTQSANLWRARYSELKKQFKDMQKEKDMLQKSEKMLRTTEECLQSYVVENRTLKGTIEEYKWLLKKSENENDCLKRKYPQCTERASIREEHHLLH